MNRSGMAIAARGLAGILAVAAIGGGASYAGSVVRKNSMIETSTAEDFAILDAGVAAEDVSGLWSELELENGRYVYDIKFYAGGKEYDYEISAENGEVLEKSVEHEEGVTDDTKTDVSAETVTDPSAENASATGKEDGRNTQQAETEDTSGPDGTQNTGKNASAEPAAGDAREGKEAGIGAEAAEKAAILDAGLEEKDVTGRWSKLEKDDGRYVYDVKFYAGSSQYDYEVLAEDGTILEREVEKEKGMTNREQNGGAAASGYISVDEAKETALRDAGRTENEVRFSSAKLDNDDGRAVYEIEFYAGSLEYDYEIDAVSGRIVESSVDEDDD